MALNSISLHSWLLLSYLLCVFHGSLIPVCHSQSSSPQNIETFYPTEALSPTQPPEPPRASPDPPAVMSRSSSSNSKIAKAVAATAAATLVVSGLIFFLVHRCLRRRRREEAVVPQTQTNGLERIEGNVRGLIVEENGLDVVYWRKLEGRNSTRDFLKEVFRRTKKKERQEGEEEKEEDEGTKSEPVQEFPLLRGKSSTSHIGILPEEDESNRITTRITLPEPGIPKRNSSAPPPSLPPPQPVPARKSPPRARPPSVKSSSKPRPTSHETPAANGKPENSSGESMPESGNGQVKLKPLHRDKANNNADRSMVRNKSDRGSFRTDQDLLEALFGYVAIKKRSPKGKSDTVNPSKEASPPG